MAKLTYQDFRTATDKVTESIPTGNPYTYAYVVGAYETMLAGIAADLPKHKQLEVIRGLESLATRISEMTLKV
jgi:hypothetical protein